MIVFLERCSIPTLLLSSVVNDLQYAALKVHEFISGLFFAAVLHFYPMADGIETGTDVSAAELKNYSAKDTASLP